MLLTNSESCVVNDCWSDFNFHNVDAGAYWHKIQKVFTCPTAEKGTFLSRDKIQKWKINKMGYFGVEFNSVKNILKATSEAQYSCSRDMQSKWFKRTANI